MNRRWSSRERLLGPSSSRTFLRLVACRQQYLPDAGRSALHRLVGVGDLLEWPRLDGGCSKQVAIEERSELVEDVRAVGPVHEHAREACDAPLVAVDLHQVDVDALMGMKPGQPAAQAKALYSRLE